MLFEYAAGVYALARLLTDFLPALNLITDLIAMIAMTVGFVMCCAFLPPPGPATADLLPVFLYDATRILGRFWRFCPGRIRQIPNTIDLPDTPKPAGPDSKRRNLPCPC